MYEAIVIMIIAASLLLVGMVLIQNPKGGGLSHAFGNVSGKFLSVKHTTSFLEKTTWALVGSVAVLSLVATFFVK